MRYGLIINPWRNWGHVGERVAIPKQMEFEWGYLWAEVEPLTGEINVWLLPEMNTEYLKPVVEQMPEYWGEKVGLVFDNSSVHKSVSKSLSGKISFKFLPSYSPELNPVERFFEELRRRIANRIFNNLSELEEAILSVVEEYFADKEKVRRLCGFSWVIEQIQPQVNMS
jgi:transposase-like protein